MQGRRNWGGRGAATPPRFCQKYVWNLFHLITLYYCMPPQIFWPSAGAAMVTWVHFMYRILYNQILNRESKCDFLLRFANKRKSTPKDPIHWDWGLVFFSFIGKRLCDSRFRIWLWGLLYMTWTQVTLDLILVLWKMMIKSILRSEICLAYAMLINRSGHLILQN